MRAADEPCIPWRDSIRAMQNSREAFRCCVGRCSGVYRRRQVSYAKLTTAVIAQAVLLQRTWKIVWSTEEVRVRRKRKELNIGGKKGKLLSFPPSAVRVKSKHTHALKCYQRHFMAQFQWSFSTSDTLERSRQIWELTKTR